MLYNIRARKTDGRTDDQDAEYLSLPTVSAGGIMRAYSTVSTSSYIGDTD